MLRDADDPRATSNDGQSDGVASGSRETPQRPCNACRRMKIRCIDKENPPCKRCKTMKLDCRFDSGTVPRIGPDESEGFMRNTNTRLETLESHVGGIGQKLDDISTFLQRIAPPQPRAPTSSSLGLDPWSPVTVRSMQSDGPNGRGMTRSPAPQYSAHDQSGPPSTDFSRPPFSNATDVSGRRETSASATWRPSPRSHFGELQSNHGASYHSSGPSTGASAAFQREEHTGSSDDDDPLEAAMTFEPFRDLTRREEDRRLRADGHTPTARERDRGKRKRADDDEEDTTWDHMRIREKGDTVANQKDPVTLGHCSEEEGRSLFDSFFKYAHPFIPILDPRDDTWDDLRRRSPFIVTVILWVSLRARDGCGLESDLTRQCKELAESMARMTLFSPVATLEIVQGLTLLTAWGEHGWRTCCHAMSLAVDMRLYRCLPYLHKIRTESRNPNGMLERQRPLIAGARLWLALVKQGYEMSYTLALPVQFSSPGHDSTKYKRELLDHPLSNIYDSRFIVSCEILETRECAFLPYQVTSPRGGKEVDVLLRQVNKGFEDVYAFWLDYYPAGLASDHFLVKELGSQKAYWIVFSNSIAWYGVHNKNDVTLLSNERREWLISAMRSAAYVLSSIGGGKQQRDSEFANHNFHVAIVATARYLIRMIELLPEVCDVYEVSLNIDKLLLKLPDYPAHPFAEVLVRSLNKARKHGVLPFTPISDDAARVSMQLQPVAPSSTEPMPILPVGLNAFPWGEEQLVLDSAPDAMPPGSTNQSTVNETVAWPDGFDLSAWFPMADDSTMAAAGNSFQADAPNWFSGSHS